MILLNQIRQSFPYQDWQLIIFTIMIWELSQLNARQLIKHKKRNIQQTYKKAIHSSYRMPRDLANGTEDSIEEIPSLYDLHSQNAINKQRNLLPVNKLVVLNSKRNSSAPKKISITHADGRKTPEFLRKNRINCTLSKNSSRNSFKSVSRASWCCCLKDEDLQQFQTKQLTMKDQYRQSRALSHIFSNQKSPSKTLKNTRVQK